MLSRGHWFDPGSKDFLSAGIIIHVDDDDTPLWLRLDVFHLISSLALHLAFHQTTSLMADVQEATQDDRPLFTCLSCSIAFLTAEDQRMTLFYSRTQIELRASRGSLPLRPP
jgi:hypothetical protein